MRWLTSNCRRSHDEDQDMSDGDVILATTSSHDEPLNSELDAIDSEIMGPENMEALFLESNIQSNLNYHNTPFHYPPHSAQYFPDEYSDYLEQADEGMLNGSLPAAPDTASLPEAMSQVSEQLQHIQDGQAHGGFGDGLEEQQAHFHQENSIESLPLPFSPNFDAEISEELPQSNFVSMFDVSTFNPPAVAVGSTNAPHLWDTEGWTPSPATDVISSHDHEGHFLFSSSQAATGDDDATSEADQNEVDEQFNLSLWDFLLRWDISFPTNGNSKKLPRGPDIASVREQHMNKPRTIQISDLNGEKCDIQGINWDELRVSRLAARQMRRQTYKNYTNLRITVQRHVSDAYLSGHWV